jgi:hypothetical protein
MTILKKLLSSDDGLLTQSDAGSVLVNGQSVNKAELHASSGLVWDWAAAILVAVDAHEARVGKISTMKGIKDVARSLQREFVRHFNNKKGPQGQPSLNDLLRVEVNAKRRALLAAGAKCHSECVVYTDKHKRVRREHHDECPLEKALFGELQLSPGGKPFRNGGFSKYAKKRLGIGWKLHSSDWRLLLEMIKATAWESYEVVSLARQNSDKLFNQQQREKAHQLELKYQGAVRTGKVQHRKRRDRSSGSKQGEVRDLFQLMDAVKAGRL